MRARSWLMGILIGAGLFHGAGRLSAADSPPNILFILTDDQGWPTLGCYGNKLVPTPHLDQLARQGMRFTDAYAMPQCTATRAALLTGQHTARNGVWHVIPWYGTPWAPVAEPAFRENLSRETFTLAKGLKSAGYVTAILGKWHLTANEDGNYVALHSASAKYYGFDESPAPPGPRYHQETDKGVAWLTGQAMAFMERHRERPWFCYLSHHTIHGPVMAPDDLVAQYRAQGAPETGLHNATYLAALEHMDRSVGQLLDKLEKLNLSRRTVVIFFSDNGGVHQQYDIAPFKDGPGTAKLLTVAAREFSNAPWRAGKGSQYEGGIRVPLIIRWPGHIPSGSVSSVPVHVVDFLPTLLDLAGATAPPDHPLDGLNLRPLWAGASLPPRDLFWYLPLYDLRWGATPCAVLRRGDWKLIEYFGDRIDRQDQYVEGSYLELFHVRNDVGESRNMADSEAELTAQMRQALHHLIEDCGAVIPGPNPHRQDDRLLRETREKPEFLKPHH